jgi:5-(carboxyamino)imidazole ribonucleotide mutase
MQSVKPIVGIMMGSQSDWTTMKHTKLTLEKLGVPCEAKIISAHRTPSRLVNYVESAKERGILVLIAGAGMAAALPGAVAALTPLPVLGVPMEGKLLGGLDAMLAMAQMPGGIPVGTLAVGKAGAVNSAILATSIIALSDEKISINLDKYRANQTANVNEDPIDEIQ